MSESSFVKKVEPQLKVSSMDTHRMITPPARPTPSSNPPRTGIAGPAGHKARTGGQPAKPQSTDVVIKSQQPIDARMQPGGVQVKHPPGSLAAKAAAAPAVQVRRPIAPDPVPAPAVPVVPAFTQGQRALLAGLLENLIANAGGATLELATETLAALEKLA